MGVNPTPTNFKTFTFGGENSRSYGVYITGEGVFNAPERNVEMIEIPGRNGAFALDRGNFNNIEVTYPAGIFADTEADFAQAVSDLRSLLCSKVGYVRLEDDYNPNEYRMAIYKSGLDVDHDLLIAGEFDLTFECKPQRYLKSGETAISVTSGDTITNPTRYDAQPLLEIEGYGNVNFNGYNIELFDDLVGNVFAELQTSYTLPYSTYLGNIYVNANDVITTHPTGFGNGFSFSAYGERKDGYTAAINSYTATNIQCTGISTSDVIVSAWTDTDSFECMVEFKNVDFSALTEKTITVSWDCTLIDSNGDQFKWYPVATVHYDGVAFISYSFTGLDFPNVFYMSGNPTVGLLNIQIQSTATTYGHPTMIDCETGETYTIQNGVAMSLGRYVSLGSELPTLASGANTITYDNTITLLKITPRWWQV